MDYVCRVGYFVWPGDTDRDRKLMFRVYPAGMQEPGQFPIYPNTFPVLYPNDTLTFSSDPGADLKEIMLTIPGLRLLASELVSPQQSGWVYPFTDVKKWARSDGSHQSVIVTDNLQCQTLTVALPPEFTKLGAI